MRTNISYPGDRPAGDEVLLIDQLHKADTVDATTFAFDGRDPEGRSKVLVMSEDGLAVDRWAAGRYAPEGTNEDLGTRSQFKDLGHVVLEGLFAWLSTPTEREHIWDAETKGFDD